jgi:hypothetical protein
MGFLCADFVSSVGVNFMRRFGHWVVSAFGLFLLFLLLLLLMSSSMIKS